MGRAILPAEAMAAGKAPCRPVLERRERRGDRLDAPDLEDDITTRPVADITEICRDLGRDALPGTHPWTRRTPNDIRHPGAPAARSAEVKDVLVLAMPLPRIGDGRQPHQQAGRPPRPAPRTAPAPPQAAPPTV